MVITIDVASTIFLPSALISLASLVLCHKLTMQHTPMRAHILEPFGSPTLVLYVTQLQTYLAWTTLKPTMDESTHTMLLTGPNEQGLYSIRLPQLQSMPKLAFTATKASSDVRHQCLGHPHAQVFRSIVSHCLLPVSDKLSNKFFSFCQLRKSSKLSLPVSTFHSDNI